MAALLLPGPSFPPGLALPSADLTLAEGGSPLTAWRGDPGPAAEGGKPDTFYSILPSAHYVIPAHICQFYFYPPFFCLDTCIASEGKMF